MKIRLNPPLTADRICRITKAIPIGIETSTPITHIATHSREVEEGTLFLSLPGAYTNGDAFYSEVISKKGYLLSEKRMTGCFSVPSVTDALYALANARILELYRRKQTVCITGSVGKTTTKELLKMILPTDGTVHATEGNQNSEIGLPLTVLAAPPETEILLLEAGMNHRGELARISHLVGPDLIVITNIGTAHIGNLGSRAAIAEAKKEILLGAKKDATVLIPYGENLLTDIQNAITVGESGADYQAVFDKRGKRLLYCKDGTTLPFPTEVADRGLFSCLCFAAAAAKELGIQNTRIEGAFSQLENNIFRQNIFYINNSKIIYDAYNASYESVLSAIDYLKQQKESERMLVLGDMLELGEHSTSLHRSIGCALAKARDRISRLFLFGKSTEAVAEAAIANGFDTKRIFRVSDVNDPQAIAEAIFPFLSNESCVLIKGARGMRMERITDLLLKRKDGDHHA